MAEAFLLLTPAHNEADQAESLVAAVRASTLMPSRWLVVDDNSTDGTGEAFLRAGRDLPFLEVQRIDSRGEYMTFRYSEVLRAGLARHALAEGGYLGILDADIRFGARYWHALRQRLEGDSRLGIASGALCARAPDGGLRLEPGQHADLPRGGLRLVRAACLAEAGGVQRSRACDTIMTTRARLAGWKTVLFEDILALSTRPTASRAEYENVGKSFGQRYYDIGRPAWYALYKACSSASQGDRARARSLLAGYFGEALRRRERAADAELRRYYRWEPQRRWLTRWKAALAGTRPPNAPIESRVLEPWELEALTAPPRAAASRLE
jgi:glycosyltransferase involved in cell wall biosynthesis